MNPSDVADTIAHSSFNLNEMIDSHDVLFITLDTLRFDAAQTAWHAGNLKTLGNFLPAQGWECRHSPATFTYAAHHAFFAGFLPTPMAPGTHPRLFASRFAGSQTTDENTFVFEEPTLPEALSKRGFRTICIGGTGFFNPASKLGTVLPSFFDEAFWSRELGVTDRNSQDNQVAQAIECLSEAPNSPTFLFINFSAIHQPNWFYANPESVDNPPIDSLDSHVAALLAVDRALENLFSFLKKRRPTFCIACSDHGTAYGEGGHVGHRLAHETVWNVPYAEFVL